MGGNVLSSNVLGPGITAVLTTAGDLLFVNAAGELVRLPIGAAAEVLTVVSGLPDWEAPAASGVPITGWVEDTGWTYVSATTFTKAGDYTAIFRKGSKLRYKQGAGYKYAYVTLSALAAGVTTITCTGGSDYSLAVGAITDAAYSHIENPEGFPGWFNYTPVFYASVTNPTIGNSIHTASFAINGRLCTFQYGLICGSTFVAGSGSYSAGLPVTAAVRTNTWRFGTGRIYQNTTVTKRVIVALIGSGVAACGLWEPNEITHAYPWAWGASDQILLSGAYEV